MSEIPNQESRELPPIVAHMDNLRLVLDSTGDTNDSDAQIKINNAIKDIANWLHQWKDVALPGNITRRALDLVLEAHAKIKSMQEIQRVQDELDTAFDEVVAPTNLFGVTDGDKSQPGTTQQKKAA
jgi:predicted metal-dependent peptidase